MIQFQDSVLDSTGDIRCKRAVDKWVEYPNASTTTDSDSPPPKIGKDEILKNGKIIKKIQLK